MSSEYSFVFYSLELAVRYGSNSSESHDDIACYVHVALERARKLTCIKAARTAHLRIVDTLIETMCDTCHNQNWRIQCHRYLKKLMPLMFEILDEGDYAKKTKEIETLYKFFVSHEQLPNKDKANLKSHSYLSKK
ncbi:hypothetical protein [Paraglaciecola sp. 2405UD69-4]|uniref:hypothetical protein n=1 Tax=Paraglaciecola sp. 2405UD69-4 TaxID=3391836 RepID=UPI0039C8DCF6